MQDRFFDALYDSVKHLAGEGMTQEDITAVIESDLLGFIANIGALVDSVYDALGTLAADVSLNA